MPQRSHSSAVFVQFVAPLLFLAQVTLGFQGQDGSPGTTSTQLASLQKQLASVEAQRESVRKQFVVTHPIAAKPVSFIAPVAQISSESCPAIPVEEAEPIIEHAAQTESLSPQLLKAVIRHESSFRPCAVSDRGAQGLMQLMPSTAEAFHVIDPFDPRQNIRGGAALLRQLMDRFGGNLRLALGAYNAGAGTVEDFGGVPAIPETQNYVRSIMAELGLDRSEPEAPANPQAEAEDAGENAVHTVVLQLSLGSLEQRPSSVRLALGEPE